MKLRNIPFSPPDMTEAEANEVREAILSGWITTGPKIGTVVKCQVFSNKLIANVLNILYL